MIIQIKTCENMFNVKSIVNISDSLRSFLFLLFCVCEVLGDDELVRRHHLESFGEQAEAGTQVHFTFKFDENRPVMEESVREESVKTAHNLQQVLGGGGGDRHSRTEIVVVLDDRRGVVQRMNHVVDGRAFLR